MDSQKIMIYGGAVAILLIVVILIVVMAKRKILTRSDPTTVSADESGGTGFKYTTPGTRVWCLFSGTSRGARGNHVDGPQFNGSYSKHYQ